MTRPIRVVFDRAALRRNHDQARRFAGNAKVWSVVKANAYGHGLRHFVGALGAEADGYALIELDAAIALRQAGVEQPILMLEGFYDPQELPLFAQYHLTPALHRLDQVEQYCRMAASSHLPVYLKLETGMHRLGMSAHELDQSLRLLESSAAASEVTLMTHFADADGVGGIKAAMDEFQRLCRGRVFPISVANSAALIRYPEARGDWVRPGIMLYGSSPFPDLHDAESLGLEPVMTLETELIAVRQLEPGDHVGYGNTFTAGTPMRIGIAAAGYADGYPRHAGTGTPISVAGKITRLLGRVSMDKLCMDLTDIPEARPGSRVTLWGRGLSADLVAAAAGTVSYELFCAVAPRVPVIAV